MRHPWGDRRGQSETLGFILLIAIAAIGITSVVVLGSAAVDDSRHAMEVGSAEHAMTEFDSQVSLVAHGDSASQLAELPSGRNQYVTTVPDAGWMNITIYNQTTGAVERTLMNETLGAILYENGDTKIAYQGGGVWERSGQGVASMVSPPEMHYQGTTLTLPLVVMRGDGGVSGTVHISQDGATNAVYPTATESNPLDQGIVSVEVHSEYYEAWGRYFAERTEGDVTVDRPAQTARINLTVPYQANFNHTVATTESGGVSVSGGGNSGPSFEYDTGVNYPAADSRILGETGDCENGSCSPGTTSITSGGSYYWDSGFSGSLTVDNPGGNVSLVVNGSATLTDLTVQNLDGHDVTLYVRQDFTIKGDLNAVDGDPSEFRVLVHSDGDVEMKGGTSFSGLLYAPKSSCEFRGSGSVTGAVVCETMNVRGGPANDFEFDESVRTSNIGLNTAISRITYLHVSTTPVNVSAA